MSQRNEHPVDVGPVADATQAADVQNTRLVIDIGDNKTIEITLRGKLTLQSMSPEAGTVAQPSPVRAGGVVLSEQAVQDQEFVDQMRGWVMTVATLFIGISFQAAMQPPSWMPRDWYRVYWKSTFRLHGAATDLSPPSPGAPASDTTIATRQQANQAFNYVFFNTSTFATSLALVVVLVTMKRFPPTFTMLLVTTMVVLLCCTIGCTFVTGNSYDPAALWMVVVILGVYGIGLACIIMTLPRFLVMRRERIRSRENNERA